MCRTYYVLATMLIASLAPSLLVADVVEEHGNIVYNSADGTRIALTTSQHDQGPVLSPDGRTVAFIRSFRPPEDDSGHGYTNCSVWVVDIEDRRPQRIVSGQYSNDPNEFLCDLHNLHFSPDGRQLYFQSLPWATESAVHVIDVLTKQRHYVISGSLVRVVPKGQYANHLLVQRHLYFFGGGSYDWVWLVSPKGDVLGPVSQGEGANGGSIDAFLELHAR